ncbi:MAG: thioredoxin domain-containing protein [Methanoregula sp.]|jgi:hypothetical protein|uniref:thioredoxin domain-containing protein n=1 Tax=Methanoregula sp. TaxID=2052170 RepID=UPI003D0A01C6
MPPETTPDPPALHTGPGDRPVHRLAREKSPYLLQHAHNPVDWYPWGDEAFSRATGENKPVFLSIGYSTCHWCHVMAHECFEDETVAALLNRDFVSIKVDREERPDIDSVYMGICQQMTGQGGWPLTIIMTPEKLPFFAGTYFPKESGHGMPGLTGILERIAALWHEQQDEIIRSADEIAALARTISFPASRDPDRLLLDAGFRELSRQFDPKNGGFGNAPKFPAPHIIIFLLRYWHVTGEPRALFMAEQTLDAIRQGGIWDHVGGGLHRYATDARWRIPHFEKMLYDQALFVLACTETFEATREDRYRTTAEECIEYVLRDLHDPGGAFYSAEDADSPGGEGAYYSWTSDELSAALGPDDAAFATSVFTLTPLPAPTQDIKGSGAQKSGQRFILSAAGPDPVLAQALSITVDNLGTRRESIRSRLFTARQKRARPARDDKILADTNALFCIALAHAGRVFKNPAYIGTASGAVEFILKHLSGKDRDLMHRYRDGESAIPAFADDYAYLVSALIALYEATFDPMYLSRALDLNSTFVTHFQDKKNGGFFATSDRSEELLVRKKEWYDGAVPSANAIAFENLTWLARVTEDKNLEVAAIACSRFLAGTAERAPTATTAFLSGLTRLLPTGDTQDLVIAGDPAQPDTRDLLDAACNQYLPGLIVLHRPPGKAGDDLEALAPVVHGCTVINGHAAAYLCTGHTCRAPIHNPGELARMLGERKTAKDVS